MYYQLLDYECCLLYIRLLIRYFASILGCIFILKGFEFFRMKFKVTYNNLQVVHDVYDVGSAKPIDLLVLLILYDTIPSQRHHIESIIRNKIRTGVFTDGVLGKIFANHVDVCLGTTCSMLLIYLKVY